MRRMNITDIPADTQLAGVKINILNRTLHLFGDGGEELQLIEQVQVTSLHAVLSMKH